MNRINAVTELLSALYVPGLTNTFVIFKLVVGRTTYTVDNYSENKTYCKKCLQNPNWLQTDVTNNSIHLFKMCCMLDRQRVVGKK